MAWNSDEEEDVDDIAAKRIKLCPELSVLRHQMLTRRMSAFSPGTTANHKSQIKIYMLFCAYFRLWELNPDCDTLCMYV